MRRKLGIGGSTVAGTLPLSQRSEADWLKIASVQRGKLRGGMAFA